eukprot:CAMPEP_0197829058 /NCGR_PEP_ID=MMETSP1437-20131217/5530_1 /TAXON_ID=49252 ORGANISM="Eucampia antarctica, Strain CCMP1452" /NCGR_SAMPLE_ID=MMETSP1437 /ASSEMBLY_ACC=CAM_ASM_001096 /LENGTH=445 /DNA_ID=CAMNT_0043430535 /DNA_START=22 /DNA_END=1359 /DNA_ORIENTATION=-
MASIDGNSSEEQVFTDLIGFLKSDRSDLRLAASEAVLSVTDRDGMTNLIRHGIVQPLCRLSSKPEEGGTNALLALVNLSSRGVSFNQCVDDMISCGGISRMTEIALSIPESESETEKWATRVNYSLALLANMSRIEVGAVDFCGASMPDEAIPSSSIANKDQSTGDDIGESIRKPSKPTVSLLLSRFLSAKYVNSEAVDEYSESNVEECSSKSDDPYQHFAAVLMNIAQVEQGRRFVIKNLRKETTQGNLNKYEKSTSVLQMILPQLKSKNPVRRQGIAGAVKNCCFEKDSSWWLLNEVNIVSHILYPLAGPEELDIDEKQGMDPDLWIEGPDKLREPDMTARLLLVESILLLCSSGRKSRELLRVQRTYVILKMADMIEESEEVSERISECVQFLRRDEDGTKEGSSDMMVEEYVNASGNLLALPAPSSSKQIGTTSDDFDDVD